MWEDDSNSDPFAGIDEDKQEIDPESYKNLFGDSGREDFYGFNDKHWPYQMFTWRTVASFINNLKYYNIN